jgi:hypothetical protein
MTELQSRLTACEIERDALRRENEHLRGRLVSLGVPVASPHLPDFETCRALYKIITARWPKLKPQYLVGRHDATDHETESVEGFRAAVAFTMSRTVTAEPIRTFGAGWWIVQAGQWARAAALPGRVTGLTPAFIACNVPFTFSDTHSVWLDPHASKGKRVDALAWKKILSGEMREPTALGAQLDQSVGFRRELAKIW